MEVAMTNRDQVTVVLPANLREFVRRAAEAEDRSMASVVRRLVAAAAAQAAGLPATDRS
jgi:CopG-like RHH_1 or ribbon-helix-helix domain, RHH_5